MRSLLLLLIFVLEYNICWYLHICWQIRCFQHKFWYPDDISKEFEFRIFSYLQIWYFHFNRILINAISIFWILNSKVLIWIEDGLFSFLLLLYSIDIKIRIGCDRHILHNLDIRNSGFSFLFSWWHSEDEWILDFYW